MASAIGFACCLAAPAQAAGALPELPAPAPDVASVSAPAAPVVDVAAEALESTATQASSSVERVVADTAGAVASTETPPAVDSALDAAAAATFPPPASGSDAGAVADPSHGRDVAATASSRVSRPQPRGAPSQRQAGTARRQALPVGPPAGPVTAMEVGGSSVHAVAGSAPSAPETAPTLDLGAIGGSPASGASTGLFFGGLALLLLAFFAAAPDLRRLLAGRRVICPPAAFIPLLERPG